MFDKENNGKNFGIWSEHLSQNNVEHMMSCVAEAENLPYGTVHSYSEWSDEDLLLEYRLTSCRDLFEELVQRYEHPLFAFLSRFIGNPEDAEEVFQSAFMKVHLKMDLFEEGRRFKPWLYRIATNIAIDRIRRNQRQLATCSEMSLESDDCDSFGLEQIVPGNEPQPFEGTLKKEEFERLRQAIHELPERLRVVLELIYFQELSYRETSEVLNIPYGSIRNRLQMAFKKLNSALQSID